MKKITALLAGAVLLLATCNKEKRDEVTKENLVGTYKLVGRESQLENQPAEDNLLAMEPCEKDDLLRLNANMTYNAMDAGTKCNPASDDISVWSLPSSKQIIMDGEAQTIKSLINGRTLVLKFTTVIFNTPVWFTSMLAKQ